MLKLIYTETDLHLEQFSSHLEDWVQQRVMFCLSVGNNITIEQSNAAFLLPIDHPNTDLVVELINQEESDLVEICQGDQEFMEVSLAGYWLTTDPQGNEGVFVSELSADLELYLFQLWEEAKSSGQLTIN